MSADCQCLYEPSWEKDSSADPEFLSQSNAVKTLCLVHVCVCMYISISVPRCMEEPMHVCVCVEVKVDFGTSSSIALDLLFSFLSCVCVYTCLSECMCVWEHPGHGACVKNRRQLSGVGSSTVYGLGDKLRPLVLAAGSFTGGVSCSTLYFEIGSFINLWAHQFRYTSWPASSVDPLPPTALQITDVGAILGR